MNLASRYDTDNSKFDNLLKSLLTMKSSLIFAFLLAFVSCPAIAADQATPTADIEPTLLAKPKAASKTSISAAEATALSGATLDDFAFAAQGQNNLPKGDEHNSSQTLESQRQLPHLEGF